MCLCKIEEQNQPLMIEKKQFVRPEGECCWQERSVHVNSQALVSFVIQGNQERQNEVDVNVHWVQNEYA